MTGHVVAAASVAGAAVTTGLLAGLYAAFSYAVMPGLARTDDATFVTAVRAVNSAILNPVFGVVFVGAPVLTGVALGARLAGHGTLGAPWLAAAFALVVAAAAVTFAVNVPLNEALAAADGATAAPAREAFEAGWVRWNAVRAVLTTAATAVLITGLMAVPRLGP